MISISKCGTASARSPYCSLGDSVETSVSLRTDATGPIQILLENVIRLAKRLLLRKWFTEHAIAAARSYAFSDRLVGLSALKTNAAAAPPSSSETM